MPLPINAIEGVMLDLHEDNRQIATARVLDPTAKYNLSWDRFVRLKAVADVINDRSPERLLDAGGYDGALALFLPHQEIDVIDPATTGGSILEIPAPSGFYDAVVAVDVLEHVQPIDRARALAELARVAKRLIVLNYPCQASKSAQELVLQLTNNALIREHVQWELPDTDWVLDELTKWGFSGTMQTHTSIAVWLGQYVTLNLVPDAAKELNRHLVENYAEEPCTKALYHLVICERS